MTLNGRSTFPWGRNIAVFLLVFAGFMPTASAQQETPDSPGTSSESEVAENSSALDALKESPRTDAARTEVWDRLIYVPFRELQKVFNNRDASVVLPYAEYLELLKRGLANVSSGTTNPDAVISSARWNAVVEKDVARITAELTIDVIRTDGWSTLPITFGNAAVGSVSPSDGSVLLKGTGQGTYELLLNGTGRKVISIELLTSVIISPEDRAFVVQCPPTGISELIVTVPQPDQTVQISPVQVLLPAEGEIPADRTVVRAGLGATREFQVRWNPRAGSKPVMDLLTTVASNTDVRIEPGLVQSRTQLQYEILRGELRDVTILVPHDARVIDLVASSGRIGPWNVESFGDTHQIIRAELLSPATNRFQLELQTERPLDGPVVQLIGSSADGKLQNVRADGVIRESGRLSVSTDPSLTAVVQSQSGVRQTESGSSEKSAAAPSSNSWEYTGIRGILVLQIKPVEPRLLVNHRVQYVFRDDELRARTVLSYTVERAGIFQLSLKVPDTLTIDSVSADGMSEFHVDRDTGRITLSLTQKRMGAIDVTVQAHQPFSASAENSEMPMPLLIPEGVERETGMISIRAPEFLDVITVEEKLSGLYPSREITTESLPRLRHVATWNFTRRPVELFVRTTPRPAQIAASVATTMRVDPEIFRQSSIISFDIRNAGVDTFRIAVPESVASDVRFRTLSPAHVIQQRERAAAAEDGWVTWTIVLQDETTGTVQLAVDWDRKATEAAASERPIDAAPNDQQDTAGSAAGREQTVVVEPPRVLTPFSEEAGSRRRAVLTQTKGEIRLLRHESLSISAESTGETTEAIDVRELELMEQEGYLAYRYYSQPASTTIRIRRHEIHQVAATVVSRCAVDVVTERQTLATWRARFRITTSERQRLRVDLPAGCDLQAPTLNGQRTTIEKATDVRAAEQWEAYYVNVSRDTTSDQDFLLTLQYRCPIVEESARPYSGRGGRQLFRLPVIGDDSGTTVTQQVRLAVWAPYDVSFPGSPEFWRRDSGRIPILLNPMRSDSATEAAQTIDHWIDPQSIATSDFPTQGSVSVFQAVGRHSQVRLTWWNRPFLFGMVSGTLVVLGLILRRTSWENRITLVLLGAFAMAAYSLNGDEALPRYLAVAWPGVLVVAGIWLTGIVLGPRSPNSAKSEPESADVRPSMTPAAVSPPRAPMTAGETVLPPGTVAPAPEVKKMMDDLMGGGK